MQHITKQAFTVKGVSDLRAMAIRQTLISKSAAEGHTVGWGCAIRDSARVTSIRAGWRSGDVTTPLVNTRHENGADLVRLLVEEVVRNAARRLRDCCLRLANDP